MADIRFCIFDKNQREFFEYDFEQIRTKVAALQVPGDKIQQSVQAAASYKVLFKRRVAPMVPRAAKRPIKAAYRIVKSRSSANHGDQVRFKSSDKLLILSGDWSDEIFYSTLTLMKKKNDFKIIQTVYDLLPAVQPAFFVPGMPEQVINYMKAIFTISHGILAISEATKKDIEYFQKLHGLPACPVKVFRLGDDFVGLEAIKPQLPVEAGKFLLCVGTVEARKNHIALYYMVREAINRGIDLPPIVIAGKHGWLVDNFIYLVKNDPIISKKIIFEPKGTDRELSWLFQNCIFTLYPSLYEGWGLPIAESLFYGKLCLSSGASSMPEIAGNLIDYYSPNNPAEVLEKTLKYLNDPISLKLKQDKIRKKYKPTTWDTTFEQVVEYLRKQ